MTRKDYELIAEVIGTVLHNDPAQLHETIKAFQYALKNDNPRFDGAVFRRRVEIVAWDVAHSSADVLD
jgi:hypothetical protein